MMFLCLAKFRLENGAPKTAAYSQAKVDPTLEIRHRRRIAANRTLCV